MVVGVTEIGNVQTKEEDIHGEERGSPEIECRKDLSNVWLCASHRGS